MDTQKFTHLDTPILKKRRRNFNLITIFGLVIVFGGVALYTIDEVKYKFFLWGAMIFYLLLIFSFRTWAMQMKKELKRRGEI